MAAAQDKLRATPFGYYEGSAVYGAEFLKQSKHMAMNLKAKADFWFVAERTGPKTATIRGEGIATYDFGFGVDWGAVGPGVDLINVMGLNMAPDARITLNPKTSVQKFTLSGQISFGDGYEVLESSFAFDLRCECEVRPG